MVICEGAGSPAEINLRDGDFANMGLARHAGLPTIVVGDIDRGGVFAALFGTVALLSPEDQALVSGFVINKFRGDVGLLRPGLDMITELTGRPVLGVLPFHLDLWLDAEDSLAYGRVLGRPGPPRGAEWLRVAVVRLPRISNATDAEALAAEPGVRVRLTVEPAEIADADLVVLPGSQVHRERPRLAARDRPGRRGRAPMPPPASRCSASAAASRCWPRRSTTRWRAAAAGSPGWACCRSSITFGPRKILARPTGDGLGAPVHGYEIHHGFVSGGAPAPLLRYADGRPEGAVVGNVSGTHWHGAFESDEFRRRFLTEAARQAGRHGFAVAPDTRFAAVRERALDVLGDLVEEHLDTDALWRLLESGPPPGLPCLPPGAPDGG